MAKKMICGNCGTAGKPKLHTKGSIAIEIILWCFFIVPGLIYSVWRMTTKEEVCRTCKQPGLVPLNSPMGQKLIAQFGQQQ